MGGCGTKQTPRSVTLQKWKTKVKSFKEYKKC